MNAERLRRFATDRDVIAGAVFVAAGVAALALGADLTIGTAAEMGEGYVPRAMAFALVGLGVLVAVVALARPVQRFSAADELARSSGTRQEIARLRPVLFVTLAVLVFAAALEPLGLFAAIAASVIAANFAGQALRPGALLLLVVLLSVAVAALFVWGLGLPLHVLPRST